MVKKVLSNVKRTVKDFSEKDLKELLLNFKSSGSGSNSDPFVIKERFELPNMFRFIDSTIHIHFYNQRINAIALNKCQNIMFTNCQFKHLELFHSSQNYLDSCSLSHLNLTGASDNEFRNCSINNARNLFSHGNIFNECSLSVISKNILMSKSMGLFDFSKIVLYAMLIIGISFISTIFFSFLGNTDYVLAAIQGFIIVVFLIVYILLKRSEKRISQRKPNVIIDKSEPENFQSQHI